jgi:putative GTP pyrophosphokinase
MKRPRISHLRKWHDAMFDHYDALGRIVVSSLYSLLGAEGIPVLNVGYRVKDTESFIAKIKKKRYMSPESECTDILGVRIITYIESDVDRASEILTRCFLVDRTRSLDKRALLEVDRVGYRSVHFIASLGEARCDLPEFSRFRSTFFEVQVRTVLQHAWAEIEHDRNYKIPTSLPPELERRLFLVAGVLELADREFNSLASDIDTYSSSVAKQAKGGDWDIDVNTPSLLVFCDSLRARFKNAKIEKARDQSSYDELVQELRDYGVKKLSDIEPLVGEQFLSKYDRDGNETTDMGILRDAMMYADLEKYLNNAWKEHWRGIDPEDFAPLKEKYGEKAMTILSERNVLIDFWHDNDFFEQETG